MTREDKHREYSKNYRENNKDKVKEYSKNYYINNKDKVKEHNKNYYINNKDKVKEHSKNYYINNKDKHREQQLNRNYGITEEEYNQMFKAQNGNCAICSRNQSEFKTRLAVDHNHETGDIRSLLCANCNLMLGYAKDNAENLAKGIEYLNSYV